MKRTSSLALASLAAFAIAVSVAGAASSPTVSTGSATSIKNHSAVLNGSVNPNGAATQYWFVYGPTTAYGGTTSHHSAGSGTGSVSVRLTAGALLPGTVYHYRLVAQNGFGTTMGRDRTFKTTGHPLPGVVTGGVTNLSAFGATLNGTVIPNGAATTWYFQYSAGAPFAPSSGGTLSASSGATNVSTVLFPLVPGFTYQYRLLGVHVSGTSYGAFQTFTTYPLVRPYPRGLSVSTKPSRDSTKPFVFTTSGTLLPSPRFPAAPQCNGTISVQFLIGKRQVHLARVPVQSNCTFSVVSIFPHTFASKVGGPRPASETLTVVVRFGGNNYIAPSKNPRIGHVTLG
jgi:hypothetical protein